MSVGTILTLGYGSFGTVNLLPMLGYGVSIAPPDAPIIPGGGAITKRKYWQKRPRYWWEKDDTYIPPDIPLAELLDDVKEEEIALAGYIDQLVIDRAAENTLRIMRTYAQILHEQMLIKQANERWSEEVASSQRMIDEQQKAVQKVIHRKKKTMLLMN